MVTVNPKTGTAPVPPADEVSRAARHWHTSVQGMERDYGCRAGGNSNFQQDLRFCRFGKLRSSLQTNPSQAFKYVVLHFTKVAVFSRIEFHKAYP